MLQKSIGILICLFFFTTGSVCPCLAAMGCSLQDPDRDVRRLFPQSTGYRTTFITIEEVGGEKLRRIIEKKLGDDFEPVYETIDVPYAFYTILVKKKIIGYIHGVNQKGEFGGLQLILATDIKGKILNFFYQRISNPEAKKLRHPKFTDLFKGLTLADFYHYDPEKGCIPNIDNPISKIENPCQRNDIDFRATLRGLKKNMIIFDEFVGGHRYDAVFKGLEIKNPSFLHPSFRPASADLQSQNPQRSTTILAVLLNRIEQIRPKFIHQFQ